MVTGELHKLLQISRNWNLVLEILAKTEDFGDNNIDQKAVKAQMSLHIGVVSPEPSFLTSKGSYK